MEHLVSDSSLVGLCSIYVYGAGIGVIGSSSPPKFFIKSLYIGVFSFVNHYIHIRQYLGYGFACPLHLLHDSLAYLLAFPLLFDYFL